MIILVKLRLPSPPKNWFDVPLQTGRIWFYDNKTTVAIKFVERMWIIWVMKEGDPPLGSNLELNFSLKKCLQQFVPTAQFLKKIEGQKNWDPDLSEPKKEAAIFLRLQK